jgi:branched-chain amino acid transport system substrate-binding protein
MTIKSALLGAAFAALITAPALAQTVKVGVMVTLSGPSAVLGQHARDGFNLFVKQNGGKLGPATAEVSVTDDELKPDVAVTKARALVERDNVDFVVGPIFSNVLQAIMKPVTDSKAILISPNAGTSNFAGKQCNANFFVTSYQNDQNHEVLGKHAQDAGYKRHFKGEVLDEVYTQLGQLDFSAELARIASMKPDAIFTFMPGGMGVNLVRQFRQAGLQTIPLLTAFTVDESTLPAQQDAAIGIFGGTTWAPNMDNAANTAFVAAFEKEYGYVPGSYAMQAFDAAQLIDSAMKATGGRTADKEAVKAALKKADIKSPRGPFRFGANNYPIQDFYLVKAAKRPDGKFQTEIVKKVFENYVDVYAKECEMK